MSQEYANNSIKNRQNKQKNEIPSAGKIVKGKTGKKKKSEITKIASAMISDEVRGIKEYAIYDVIIPVIKDTIVQLVESSVQMIFLGEVRSRSSRRSSTGSSRVSYSSYYDDRHKDDRRDSRRSSARISYDDITFEYKEDAVDVLERMDEIAEQFGVVRLSDFFEMAGETGNGPTDHNYGWTSTKSATVERDRSGVYYIKIHRPSPVR